MGWLDIAWQLAVVPLSVNLLLSSFLGYIYSGNLSTIIIIALNIIFIAFDSNQFRKAGQKVELWLWMELVLVPVYLFVRASRVDRKYGYAIAWCVGSVKVFL